MSRRRDQMPSFHAKLPLELLAVPCRNCTRTCKETVDSHILWCGNQLFKKVPAYPDAIPCAVAYENAVTTLRAYGKSLVTERPTTNAKEHHDAH